MAKKKIDTIPLFTIIVNKEIDDMISKLTNVRDNLDFDNSKKLYHASDVEEIIDYLVYNMSKTKENINQSLYSNVFSKEELA